VLWSDLRPYAPMCFLTLSSGEFERSLIRERQRDGIALAKQL